MDYGSLEEVRIDWKWQRKARFQLTITDKTSELTDVSSIVHKSIFHLLINIIGSG